MHKKASPGQRQPADRLDHFYLLMKSRRPRSLEKIYNKRRTASRRTDHGLLPIEDAPRLKTRAYTHAPRKISYNTKAGDKQKEI